MKAITITRSLGLAAATGDSQQFRTLNPQTLTIDIVLPVLNEAHIIEASISKLHKYLIDNLPYRWQIIIADNGSSDGTYQIAQQLTKRWSGVRLVRLNERGLGLALKTVWQKSKADILAYMDIDLSTNLDSFMPMISPLITGEAGLATGSRLMKESRTTRGFKREIISRCYNRIIRTIMKTNFVDAQCGFKAIRRDLAQKLLPHIKDKAWFFDTELLVKAEYEGYKIHEEPVKWVEDADSRVRIVETAADDIKGLSRVRKEYGKSSFGEMAAFGGLLLFTSIFYLWNLTINGMANSYYAAAAQAASTSWLAWLFGSLDAANFVSVDKPPISMMIMGLFGRLFVFSSWSMLLPHALAGIATVALVYLVVRRWYGARAGLIAGVVMALTPAAALMFRFNNPDSFLTLFLTASAYSFLRSFEVNKPVLWLSLAGLFTGFAFNTKMLQGLLLLPIMTIIYIGFARPKFTTRMWHLGVACIATIVSTFWWSILVWLTPAASRPWVGSTSDNSIWSLMFGYNGFGRLLGNSGGPGGVGFGGETGVLRILNESFGPNIAWLIPVALISAGLVIWLLRRAPRHNKERIGVLLWLGWLLMHIVIFSMTSGTIHPYYVVAMTPAVAALVGIGAPYIWQAYTRRTKVAWILPLSIALTTILSIIMLGYSNYWPWLMWLVMIAGGVATILTLLPLSQTRRLKQIILGLAITASMAAPIVFSVSTVATAHSGSIPTAGPGASAMSNTNNESARAESTLISFLLENRHGTIWLAAVNSANESAPIQLSSGQPVMAIGGFNGSDSTLTLSQLKQLVKQGKVRYYVVNSRQGKSGGPSGMGGPGGNSEILLWVKSAGSKVDYGGTQYTVYDLAAAA